MAKFAGVALLLKVSNGNSPETFTTVAGQRSTSLTINDEEIDVTDKDDSRWKKQIEGGVRSMALSASGLLTDGASVDDVVEAIVAGEITRFQIACGLGTFTGPFKITSVEIGGEYTDAQTLSISLTSAGDIVKA